MRKRLTDRGVETQQPPASGRAMVYDTIVPGFALRVTSTGAKSYVLAARFPPEGIFTRRFVGKAGAMSLAAARTKAQGWLALIAEGKDPAEHEASEQRRQARLRAVTFEAVAERFISERLTGLRTAHVTAQEVRGYLIPRWGKRPVTSITVDDMVELCDEFRASDKAIHGHKIVGHARRIFRWAIARRSFGVAANPCDGLDLSDLLSPLRTRERVLSDAELRAVWRACDRCGYPTGSLVKLLMLTAVRRDETADAQWLEFDLPQRLWTIPAARMKSKRPHVVPLTAPVLQLIDGLPRLNGPHMFSTTGGQVPVSGFSKMKARLNAIVAHELGEEPDNWTLHDIRRTVRSRLSELRIAPAVAESVLAHAPAACLSL